MITATELKEGMALRIDGQIYKVLEVESKAGQAKMGGSVHTKLSNLRGGRIWDQSFRPQERLEDVELEQSHLEFLFSDGTTCTFQRLDTYEQVEFPAYNLGLAERFLQSGMEATAEFFEGEPIHLVLPETVEARVVTTAPPTRSQQDVSQKEATLDNGVIVQIPTFISAGETVSVDPKTGRYVERVRMQHKKGA